MKFTSAIFSTIMAAVAGTVVVNAGTLRLCQGENGAGPCYDAPYVSNACVDVVPGYNDKVQSISSPISVNCVLSKHITCSGETNTQILLVANIPQNLGSFTEMSSFSCLV